MSGNAGDVPVLRIPVGQLLVELRLLVKHGVTVVMLLEFAEELQGLYKLPFVVEGGPTRQGQALRLFELMKTAVEMSAGPGAIRCALLLGLHEDTEGTSETYRISETIRYEANIYVGRKERIEVPSYKRRRLGPLLRIYISHLTLAHQAVMARLEPGAAEVSEGGV